MKQHHSSTQLQVWTTDVKSRQYAWKILYSQTTPMSFNTFLTSNDNEAHNLYPVSFFRHSKPQYMLTSSSQYLYLLIQTQFSYLHAGLRTSTLVQYISLSSLILNAHYFSIPIRLLICTTLTTSESGEQSVPGVTWGLYCTCCCAASKKFELLFPADFFLFYLWAVLVINSY